MAEWEQSPPVSEWEKSPPASGDDGGPLGIAMQAAGGFNETIAGMIEAPTRALNATVGHIVKPVADLVGTGIRSLTGQEPMTPEQRTAAEAEQQSGTISNLFRKHTVPPAPTTAIGRIARAAGTEVGNTLPLAAAPFALARRPMMAATTLGERIAQAYLVPISRSPGVAATGEALAATGAGIGGGIAEEVAPGDELAKMGAELGGGIVPALAAGTPTALAVRGVRAVASKFSKRAAEERATETVAKTLQGEATQRAAGNIQETDKVAARLKEETGQDPQFSLAERTKSTALKRTQEDIEGKAQGAELEALQGRRRQVEDTIEGFGENVAPEADQQIDVVIDSARNRVRDVRGRAEGQAERAQGARQRVAESLPTDRKAETGANIREQLRNERNQARDEMTRRSRSLGIDGIDTTDEMRILLDDIDARMSPVSELADPGKRPAALTALRRSISRRDPDNIPDGEEPPPPLTFNDLKALRERVSDELIDQLGSATPSRKTVRNLVLMRRAIDDAVQAVGDSIGDEALRSRYDAFRRDYFENIINRFERGSAYRVVQRDGRAFYRLPDEKVADAFFQPGGVTAARQFRELFGQRADDLIMDTALDSFRQAAVRQGIVDERLASTWMRRHASVLDEFPAIRERLTDTATRNENIAMRQGALARRIARIDDNILAREVGAVDRSVRTAAQAADRMLKNPKLLNSALKSLDPAGRRALQRHVWDSVVDGSGDDIAKFIAQNRTALGRIFDGNHLRNLEVIQKARQTLDFTRPPTGEGFSPNALGDLERALGQRVPVLGSRIYALKTGRVQKGYLMIDAFSRSFLGKQQTSAEDLMKLALYNPRVARELSSFVRLDRVPPERANRLNVWLFNLGSEPGSDERE